MREVLAKDDGAAETSTWANYAAKPDTDKATEARFPDGQYTIHVLASDLIHTDVDLTTTVRIENFCPIVCSATPTGTLPCNTTIATGSVNFNEPMDTSVDPSTIISIDNGATVSEVEWETNQRIEFMIGGLVNGATYTVPSRARTPRISPARRETGSSTATRTGLAATTTLTSSPSGRTGLRVWTHRRRTVREAGP